MLSAHSWRGMEFEGQKKNNNNIIVIAIPMTLVGKEIYIDFY